MQGDFEMLIKIIIPVILLVFWALSNVFNRENPQNAAKDRMTPNPSRPASYPPPRPVERRPAPAHRYVPPRENDEVLIIRAEPNRPQPRPGGNGPGRRQAGRQRGAQSGGPSGRRAEPSPSRNRDLVGGSLATDVNQSLTRPLELRPLSESLADSASVTNDPAPAASSAASSPSAAAIRTNLGDPSRIREAFVLNEILQPPLSLRRR